MCAEFGIGCAITSYLPTMKRLRSSMGMLMRLRESCLLLGLDAARAAAARPAAEHLVAQRRHLGLAQPLRVGAQLAHLDGAESVDPFPGPLHCPAAAHDAHR